jgi:hypothetical protein
MLITSNIISGCKNCGRDRKIFQKWYKCERLITNYGWV